MAVLRFATTPYEGSRLPPNPTLFRRFTAVIAVVGLAAGSPFPHTATSAPATPQPATLPCDVPTPRPQTHRRNRLDDATACPLRRRPHAPMPARHPHTAKGAAPRRTPRRMTATPLLEFLFLRAAAHGPWSVSL